MCPAFSEEIDRFLDVYHVMSFSTVLDKQPWAASLFYAFDARTRQLVYFTDEATRHGRASLANHRVAATIAPQERDVSKISGLQISGTTVLLAEDDAEKARTVFADRFPGIPTNLAPIWALRPLYIKMVDNARGFGHKQEWTAS